MKIITLTDIHGHLEAIDHVGQILVSADLILLCGDLTHFGKDKDVRKVMDTVKNYNQNILAVPGNCDHHQVETYLHQNQISLHGRGKILNGLGIIGLGGSLPCPGRTPNEYSENQLADILEKGRALLQEWEGPLILVSHQPPLNTINDRITENLHVGSKAVRTFIELHQPLICFTGHIHEGVGIDTLGQTRIVNPGPLRNGGYTFAEIEETVTTLEIREF